MRILDNEKGIFSKGIGAKTVTLPSFVAGVRAHTGARKAQKLNMLQTDRDRKAGPMQQHRITCIGCDQALRFSVDITVDLHGWLSHKILCKDLQCVDYRHSCKY